MLAGRDASDLARRCIKPADQDLLRIPKLEGISLTAKWPASSTACSRMPGRRDMP